MTGSHGDAKMDICPREKVRHGVVVVVLSPMAGYAGASFYKGRKAPYKLAPAISGLAIIECL